MQNPDFGATCGIAKRRQNRPQSRPLQIGLHRAVQGEPCYPTNRPGQAKSPLPRRERARVRVRPTKQRNHTSRQNHIPTDAQDDGERVNLSEIQSAPRVNKQTNVWHRLITSAFARAQVSSTKSAEPGAGQFASKHRSPDFLVSFRHGGYFPSHAPLASTCSVLDSPRSCLEISSISSRLRHASRSGESAMIDSWNMNSREPCSSPPTKKYALASFTRR